MMRLLLATLVLAANVSVHAAPTLIRAPISATIKFTGQVTTSVITRNPGNLLLDPVPIGTSFDWTFSFNAGDQLCVDDATPTVMSFSGLGLFTQPPSGPILSCGEYPVTRGVSASGFRFENIVDGFPAFQFWNGPTIDLTTGAVTYGLIGNVGGVSPAGRGLLNLGLAGGNYDWVRESGVGSPVFGLATITGSWSNSVTLAQAPEPNSLLLLIPAVAAIGFARRRRR